MPDVKALGGELVMECQAELVPLLASTKVVDRFIPIGGLLPEADWHCSLCSLPGLLTPDLMAVSNLSYLAPTGLQPPALATLLNRAGSKLHVGIVWSGSTSFAGNAERAAPLSRFVQSFSLPGVQLFSLQKGPPEAELEAMPAGSVIDLAPMLDDFASTAAVINALDLVIMTDTAVAHLCGAIGKPVWVLLGAMPHWLWLHGRPDSPWYGSMRLFRQHPPGDWTGVFDHAAAELLALTLKPR